MIQRKMYIRTTYVMLTHRCPMNCSYCYIDKSKTEDIKYKTIDKFIVNVMNKQCLGGAGIIFFGGEPLLRIDLMEELSRKHEWLFSNGKCSIVTGASVNMNRYLDLYEKYEIDTQISYDGILNMNTRRSFLDIDSLKGFFDLAIAGHRKFQFRKTVAEDNVNSLYEDYSNISDICIKDNISFDFSVVHQKEFTKNFHDNLYLQLTKIWNHIGKRIQDNKPVYVCMTLLEDILHIINYLENPFGATINSCEFGNILVLDCDGSLYPCTMLSQVDDYFKIGDVDNGIDMDKLDSFMVDKKCNCDYSNICNGGCVWERYVNYGKEWENKILKSTCRNVHIKKTAALNFLNMLDENAKMFIYSLVRSYASMQKLRFEYGEYSEARQISQKAVKSSIKESVFTNYD
jgi:uncharacterized protein